MSLHLTFPGAETNMGRLTVGFCTTLSTVAAMRGSRQSALSTPWFSRRWREG